MTNFHGVLNSLQKLQRRLVSKENRFFIKNLIKGVLAPFAIVLAIAGLIIILLGLK